MKTFALLTVVAALVAFSAIPVSADVIDDEPTPGLEPARRPAPMPPPPPAPPPARKPAPPPPPPPPMAKPAPPPPAPPPAAPAPMAADMWRFEVAAWLWIHDFVGDSVIRGNSVELSHSLRDSFDDFDSKSYGGRAEAWRNRLGFFVESGLNDVDGDDIARFNGFDTNYDLERVFVDFGLSYQALRHELGDNRLLTFEPIVGGRWVQIDQRGSPGAGPAFRAQDRDHYWEPFVGGRVVADLTDRLQLRVGGDAGGFSAGSELTWNALAELGVKVAGPLSLRVGYAAQGIDYEARGGAHQLDAVAHGPRFGVALNF